MDRFNLSVITMYIAMTDQFEDCFTSFIRKNFKTVWTKPPTGDKSHSQVVPECDLRQGDQSLLESTRGFGDPFEHEAIFPRVRDTDLFISDHVFELNKKELSDKEISALEVGLGFAPAFSYINKVYLSKGHQEFSINTYYWKTYHLSLNIDDSYIDLDKIKFNGK